MGGDDNPVGPMRFFRSLSTESKCYDHLTGMLEAPNTLSATIHLLMLQSKESVRKLKASGILEAPKAPWNIIHDWLNGKYYNFLINSHSSIIMVKKFGK